MSRLEDYIELVPKYSDNRSGYKLAGEMLGYLRSQANLPYPTTKLNGISSQSEGQQWLLRGDRDCDLVGIRVYRNLAESGNWKKHHINLYVLYKKGTWERLESRTAYAIGNNSNGEVEHNGWKPFEDVLDEYADIIMHLLDVYQVAVIK
tara:strand:- start:21 stop:467 length:447 start_codon:yes stop_codon:yes gene_type:complete